MSASYQPCYEFYSSAEGFWAETPDRTAYGDNPENLVTGGSFHFHRHGGCLDGAIACEYELTTLVRTGWYLRVRLYSGGPTIYAGRIMRFEHTYMGPATIQVYGFIKWFSAFTDEERLFVGSAAGDAIAELAETIRGEIADHFTMGDVHAGMVAGDDPVTTYRMVESLANLRAEIESIAIAAGDVFYGFFGEVSPIEDLSALHPLHFQVAQGRPEVTRRYSIGRDVELTGHDSNADTIVNSLVLFGAREDHNWTLENPDSIAKYGLRRKWAQRSMLEDQRLAHEMLEAMLGVVSAEREQWSFTLTHSNTEGDDLNLIETGLPYPWTDRIALMDHSGGLLISNADTVEMTVEMGDSLRVSVTMGDVEDIDIMEMFGLDSLSEKPFIPDILISDSASSSATPATPADLLTNEPPVGFYLPQRTASGLSYPAVAEGKYTYDDYVYHHTDPTVGMVFDAKSKTQYLGFYEVMKAIRWAGVGTTVYTDADGAVKALATHYDTTGARAKWNLAAGSRDWSYSDARLSSYAQFVSRNYRYSNMEHVVQTTANTNDRQAGESWLTEDGGASQRYGVLKQVPHALCLHLGGGMRGLVPGAELLQSNFDYILDEYGGSQNVYSVLVERFPYEVDYSVSPTTYRPSDFASRAMYFTERGATIAAAVGYFYEPVLVFDPAPGAGGYEIETGATAETNQAHKAYWGLAENATITEKVRSLALWDTPPVPSWNVKLIRVKRLINGLTRIGAGARRNPLPSETSVSKSYGLLGYKYWEYRIRGWDDDSSNTFE